LVEALVKAVQALGGQILTEQSVEKVLIDDGRAVGVRTTQGTEYRANHGVISSIDASRLFLQLLDPSNVDAADPKLRQRVERRVVNDNEAILKIDCALSEPLRFEHYHHRDEYWIGSVLIADSVKQVELAHSEPRLGRIPDSDPSMYVVCPTMRDPSMAPPGKHTLWNEFFAPYRIEGAEGTGLNGTGWTDDRKYQGPIGCSISWRNTHPI
jgi:beta-carotene ketolase (CrtO type)